MPNHQSHHIKNLLLPCLIFSTATGIFTTLLITLFQFAAKQVIAFSGVLYDAVRTQPVWLPCLVAGAALVGFIASLIHAFSQSCRGGGIPTTIAVIRGFTAMNWIKSAFLLPISALLSFLCGLPLGTEGPCVQMGAAVGDGVVRVIGGKKHIGWRRYIMTGGASAGFSLVTGAPITSIIFSMEEVHQHFSPLLFSVASISVIVSQAVVRLLARFGIGTIALFHLDEIRTLPLSLFYLPLLIGLLCGVCSFLFTRFYHRIDKVIRIKLSALPAKIKFPIIFVCVALIGFFISEILGTGHSLIDSLFETKSTWYLLIVVFLVRAIFMMVANTAGITGGIFLPTLAFGAILGALCAQAFIALGVIGDDFYILCIALGICSFLGASSRIPVTAIFFAIEALCGIHNVLAIVAAVTVAFLVIELSGLHDFTDAVIETKANAIHEGKEPYHVEVPLTVYKGSFVIDKEVKDILWPAFCVVLSVKKSHNDHEKTSIVEGDVLTVYYKTYDPIATAEEFEVLVGDQCEEIDRIMRPRTDETQKST